MLGTVPYGEFATFLGEHNHLIREPGTKPMNDDLTNGMPLPDETASSPTELALTLGYRL